MNAMNRVFLMGYLTRDPEVRQTPSGQSVCDLGLAVTERYRNKAGEAAETTCFADIVVWGKQAENCGRYLAKGKPVLIEGKLQFEQWEGEDGGKRSRLRIRADRVQFLGMPKGDGGGNGEAVEAEPPF